MTSGHGCGGDPCPGGPVLLRLGPAESNGNTLQLNQGRSNASLLLFFPPISGGIFPPISGSRYLFSRQFLVVFSRQILVVFSRHGCWLFFFPLIYYFYRQFKAGIHCHLIFFLPFFSPRNMPMFYYLTNWRLCFSDA